MPIDFFDKDDTLYIIWSGVLIDSTLLEYYKFNINKLGKKNEFIIAQNVDLTNISGDVIIDLYSLIKDRYNDKIKIGVYSNNIIMKILVDLYKIFIKESTNPQIKLKCFEDENLAIEWLNKGE